ncbi:hypothetical protein DMX03_26610 [Pseudomonas koreensis]|nr:hypothetical protein DMX03_26610 [Pseudomonas koreensis]RRW50386.1 hypothetical protein EGJ55_25900 [Pseudomonas moraviensis]
MVEHPGMWGRARALFRVGTVVGLQRKQSGSGQCRVGTGIDGAWVSASIIGRGLTIKQAQTMQLYRAGTRAGTDEVSQISTLLTRFSSVSRISSR